MIQIGAQAATIDSPIEHLVACHRRIEQRLDTLIRAGASLADNRTAALTAIANSLRFLDTSGALHTQDEEASLFPRLRAKISAEENAFLDALEAQHHEAEEIYSELKGLATELEARNEPSPDLLAAYAGCAQRFGQFYRAHIRSEDKILTAMARGSLDSCEIDAIAQEMRLRRK